MALRKIEDKRLQTKTDWEARRLAIEELDRNYLAIATVAEGLMRMAGRDLETPKPRGFAHRTVGCAGREAMKAGIITAEKDTMWRGRRSAPGR